MHFITTALAHHTFSHNKVVLVLRKSDSCVSRSLGGKREWKNVLSYNSCAKNDIWTATMWWSGRVGGKTPSTFARNFLEKCSRSGSKGVFFKSLKNVEWCLVILWSWVGGLSCHNSREPCDYDVILAVSLWGMITLRSFELELRNLERDYLYGCSS